MNQPRTRAVLRLRAGLRRPPRAGALRDDRRASASPRSRRLASPAIGAIGAAGVVAAVAGALIAARSRCAAPIPDQPELDGYKQRRSRTAAGHRRIGRGRAAGLSLRRQPALDTVLLELPLGEPAFDIRYMFYSTLHWKPLVNGYSGGAPLGLRLLDESCRTSRHAPTARGRRWSTPGRRTIVHEGRVTIASLRAR